jgi:hypothetical protein
MHTQTHRDTEAHKHTHTVAVDVGAAKHVSQPVDAAAVVHARHELLDELRDHKRVRRLVRRTLARLHNDTRAHTGVDHPHNIVGGRVVDERAMGVCSCFGIRNG